MNPNNKPTEIQLDHLLEDLITDLRAEHRSIQLPTSLEASILQQASLAAPRRTSTIRVWAISLAAAAALVVAFIALYSRPSRHSIQTATTTHVPPPQSLQMPSTETAVNNQTPHPHPHKQPRSKASLQEHPDSFVPLPASIGLPEPTQTMLIRTRIDTSSLRSYGLTAPPPGAPQTVLADLVIGEDGLPRAIRLVP